MNNDTTADHRRAPSLAPAPRVCPIDGTSLQGRRSDAIYCSDRCSKRARRGLGPLARTSPADPSKPTADSVRTSGASEAAPEASQAPTSALLRWMDKRHYAARQADGIEWKLYLPLDKLLVELNGALRQLAKRGLSPGLPVQTAASLTALLLEAGVNPEFPLMLPLGGPKERWLDPLHRSKRAAADLAPRPLAGSAAH